MISLLRKLFNRAKPVRVDDYLYFRYQDEKGKDTQRFVHVIEVNPNYIKVWDYNRDGYRSFRRSKMSEITKMNERFGWVKSKIGWIGMRPSSNFWN